MSKVIVVFVHGWSVNNLNTYGELPLRLRAEAAAAGIKLEIKEIFLGRYVSFHDEVRLNDISRAFRTAVDEQLGSLISKGNRFVCITHSTGGPAIRDWWQRYYPLGSKSKCPMSHLIMLAPANYGSALAQLGKARVGRLKSWFEGVEPGQGVLDWLELGSSEAWQLNKAWIFSDGSDIDANGVFPFVITGQYIDRAFYDNLNTYTGEIGSDGVVRVAAANLEARYIKLQQPVVTKNEKGNLECGHLEVGLFKESPQTPLRIVSNKSHSGDDMGIMKSVRKRVAADKSSETMKAILDCLNVKSKSDYDNLYDQFFLESSMVQEMERIEKEDRLLLHDRIFIHDRFSMVIFRVLDSEGYPVKDFDLLLTGTDSDPDHLPVGFFADKQRNRLNPETITYLVNYDIANGVGQLADKNGKEVRAKLPGINTLGFIINPRPEKGFVQYLSCEIKATKELFEKAIVPNSTTLIEICLQRIVHKTVFELEELKGDSMPTTKAGNFKDIKPGNELVK
jgi:hypothetical protein